MPGIVSQHSGATLCGVAYRAMKSSPPHLKTRQVVTWPLPETAQSPALQHKKGPYGKTANKGAVTSGIVLLSPHGEKVSIKEKNSTSGK